MVVIVMMAQYKEPLEVYRLVKVLEAMNL